MKRHFIPLLLSLFIWISAILGACSAETEPDINSAASSSSSGSEAGLDESAVGGIDSLITRPADYPTLCGSFMQPGAFSGYSVSRMKEHLQYMYDVGIDILVLQWSFETAGDKVTNVYYESSFDSSDKADNFRENGKMLLDTILQAAEEVGTKVFIGLNDNAEWWNKGVNDKAWLTDQAELGVKGAEQIYETYKEKYPNALYGWYFVFEFYNFQANSTQLKNAAYLLNQFRNGLYEIAPEMPMMLSPYISSIGASPKKTGELWEKIFANTDFREGDIFCCQDSVGAGHITIDRLDEYYSEIKEAVDTEEGLRFWANNEDFTQENWSTAPLDRFVEQLKISDKYVEAHITFAYSHYQNPDVGKMGYHMAYKNYYETGTIPETTLVKPAVEYTADDNGTVVNISGSIENPDKTVMGIGLIKNGETVEFLDFSAEYGKDEYRFDFTDYNISGSGTAEYEIYGVDYYNHLGPAYEFSVDYTGKSGTNIAAGKSYITLSPAESGYPDESGSALTDGAFGSAAYNDTAWVGFLGTPEFVFDLGDADNSIYAIELNTLGGGSAGVYAPTEITVWISDNGTDFTQFAVENFDSDPGVNSQYTFNRSLIFDSEVSARYVKISVSTNQSWIFIDEISIYAE